MKFLITGGAGFIGSALIRHLIEDTNHTILNIDKLTYASNLEALKSVDNEDRYEFHKLDICEAIKVEEIFEKFNPDIVMHLAAESHVDQSIIYSQKFIESNNPCFIKMELPDSIDFSVNKSSQKFFNVRENSVHGLDLLNFLLPSIKLVKVEEHMQPNGAFSRSVFLKTNRGDSSMIFLNWNSPSNFSLNIEALPFRLELKPFESYSLFKGMEIIEASEEYPIRQYVPKLIETENVFSKSKEFKPGFLEQAKEYEEHSWLLKG